MQRRFGGLSLGDFPRLLFATPSSSGGPRESSGPHAQAVDNDLEQSPPDRTPPSALAPTPAHLLARAKNGDGPALGQLLALYDNYLALLARLHVGKRLQVKVEPQDVIQETYLEAHRSITQFQGESEREFIAWLRRIFAAVLANQVRRYFGTRRRDIRLERALVEDLDRSSMSLDRRLVAPQSSPSHHAARREQAVHLANALNELPEDYREVIILRQLEDLSFAEVSERMGRSEHSVKNLWARALARLRRTMDDPR